MEPSEYSEIVSEACSDDKDFRSLHVVPTLHWDREWFLPFQSMRLRLVATLDHIIYILSNKSYFKMFLLDGQTLVIKDYLEVRPEKTAIVNDLIKTGRLVIGPWYVQTDQFLVSQEALVRNLLYGYQEASRWGKPTSTAYLPDACGCISQLPQIAKLCNLEIAIVYRGVSSDPISKLEYMWQGLDGSKILLVYVPYGYSTVTPSLIERSEKRQALIQRLQDLQTRSNYQDILLLCNTESDLNSFLERLNEFTKDITFNVNIKLSSLKDYIISIQQHTSHLPSLTGELRTSQESIMHPGVASTRINLKLLNRSTELSLEWKAEPLDAIATLLGNNSFLPFLHVAWHLLLENQSEDALRGCHVDTVSQYMIRRYIETNDISNSIIDECLNYIANSIDTSKFIESTEIGMIVFNLLGWVRTQVALLSLRLPLTWAAMLQQRKKQLRILDDASKDVPFVICSHNIIHHSELKPLTRPVYQTLQEYHILMLIDAIPPVGYKAFRVQLCSSNELPLQIYEGGAKTYAKDVIENEVRCRWDSLENGKLHVKINANGTLDITNKALGQVYRGCMIFEDSGDAGDTYTYSPPEHQKIITSLYAQATTEIIEQTPLRATIAINIVLSLPIGLTPDRHQRKEEEALIHIRTLVSLGLTSDQVNLDINVMNNIRDHRLRVLFPSDIATSSVTVGTSFGSQQRPCRPKYLSEEMRGEYSSPIAPMQYFVDLAKTGRGLGIMIGGLREYEILEDDRYTIALTLLRSVGFVNRNDLLLRQRPLAPAQFPAEEAQVIGNHSFKLALFPHDGNQTTYSLLKRSLEHEVGFLSTITNSHSGFLRSIQSFLDIESDMIILSSMKVAEDQKGIIIRMFNSESRTVSTAVKFYFNIESISVANLIEQTIDAQCQLLNERTALLAFGPYQIITIKVRFDMGS